MELLSLLVAGLGIVIAAAIFYYIFTQVSRSNGHFTSGNAVQALIAVAILFAGFTGSSSFGQIDAGRLGLQKSFGGYTGKVFQPGFFATTPIFTSVETVDVKNQHENLPQMVMLTREQQSVPVDASINFSLNGANKTSIINTMQYIGGDYYSKAIESQFIAALRATIAKYTFAQLTTNADVVTNDVMLDTVRRVHQISGTDAIQISQVSIKQIQPSDALKQSIEQKVVAQQQAQTAQINLQRIGYETQQSVVKAKGQAEAQQYQARTITSDYLKLQQIEVMKAATDKWDGHIQPFASNPFGSNTGGLGGSTTILDARDLMTGAALGSKP